MFDEIKVDYLLDEPKHNELDFQSKSLGSAMDKFLIRVDGSIMIEEYDVEDRSDPNATGIMRFAGCMTRINQKWVPYSYHGYIDIYDTDENGDWVEYRLKVTDDYVVSAERTNVRTELTRDN